MLGALARTGMPIVDVEAGCASGGAALQLAAGAIRAGQYDCVLVFGVEKMPKGIIRSSFFEPWREEAGLAATPAYFALRAQRLLRESGLTKQHLAEVVVKNRAQRRAQPQRDVPQGGHRGSRARLASSCASRCTSGCCARPTKAPPRSCCGAHDGTSASSVTLASARLRSHLPGSVLGEATPLSGIDDSDITPPSTLAAHDAYEEAGVGPDDVDVVECQDTDAARELLAYQELGLCAPGEQAKLLAAGATTHRGRPARQPERRIAVEGRAARRVGARAGHRARAPAARRGRARAKWQGARVGLAHTVGRGANACCVIVTR